MNNSRLAGFHPVGGGGIKHLFCLQYCIKQFGGIKLFPDKHIKSPTKLYMLHVCPLTCRTPPLLNFCHYNMKP